MNQIVKVRNIMRLVAATSAALFAMSAGSAFASTFDGSNDHTGPYSDNNNAFDASSRLDFRVNNRANLRNNVDADINTGDNRVEKNTEASDNGTGNIDVAVAFDNTANTGGDDPSWLLASPEVTADFNNDHTGPYSSNKNKLDVRNNVDVNVNNTADIKNTANLDLNTGRNRTKGNTEANGNGTGDINVSIDAVNVANQGSGGYAAGLGGVGSGGGDVSATSNNSSTGPDSQNKSTVNVHNNTDVDVNNKADINNKVNIDANTGDNRTEKNTQANGNQTGNVGVQIQLQNSANTQ